MAKNGKYPSIQVTTISCYSVKHMNNKSLQCYEFRCVAHLIANNTDTHFWFWWIREYGSKDRHAVNQQHISFLRAGTEGISWSFCHGETSVGCDEAQSDRALVFRC